LHVEGPKALDDDEIAFLKARDDEKRLRYLERELEDMREVEKFQVSHTNMFELSRL
jgi:hypothetical protein